MTKKLKTVIIEFPGEPLTKSNAAIAKWNKKTKKSTFTYRAKNIAYELELKDFSINYCLTNKIKPFKGPVHLDITYYLGTKRKKDLQNLPKTTCDALIGSVYDDDSQVVTMSIRKLFDKDNPRTIITVTELPSDELTLSIYPINFKCKPARNPSKRIPKTKKS